MALERGPSGDCEGGLGTALENLRAEVIEISPAAKAMADALPAPTMNRQRLAFGRIQSLATKTAQQRAHHSSLRTRRTPRSRRTWRSTNLSGFPREGDSRQVPEPPQRELFSADPALPDAVAINARCLVRTQDGYCVVLVAGIPIAHYAVGDAMAEAHAMVSLIEQGWADQVDVTRAFGRSDRSVRATSAVSRTAVWPRSAAGAGIRQVARARTVRAATRQPAA